MVLSAKVSNRLGGFVRNISLNGGRRRRIDSALANLQSWIGQTNLQRIVVNDLLPQGSYAHQTVIRPVSPKDEYDVDMILPIDVERHREGYQGPADILQYLRNSLAKYPDYAGKLQQRRCCVRIRFAGAFHLDVVPAHVTGDADVPYEVPNRDNDDWDPSNPPGYNDWIEQVNGGPSKFFMRQATKAFKRWRDEKFSRTTGPKSVVLTTLLGEYNPTRVDSSEVSAELFFFEDPNLLTYMTDTATILCEALDRRSSSPKVWNPSLPEGSENLARHWDDGDFRLFVDRLQVLSERLRKAYKSKDPDRSIRLLRSQFGDAFPVGYAWSLSPSA